MKKTVKISTVACSPFTADGCGDVVSPGNVFHLQQEQSPREETGLSNSIMDLKRMGKF